MNVAKLETQDPVEIDSKRNLAASPEEQAFFALIRKTRRGIHHLPVDIEKQIDAMISDREILAGALSIVVREL